MLCWRTKLSVRFQLLLFIHLEEYSSFFFCLLIPTTALFSLVSVWLCSDRCFMEQASSVSQKPSSSTKIVSAKVKKAVDSHPEPMNSGHEKPTKSFCPHHHNDHFS